MRNRPLTSPPPSPPATRAEVDRFLKGLQEFRAKGEYPLDDAEVGKYDEAGVKAYLDKMTVGSQQAIARRIMMDLVNSPSYKGREEPERERKPTKKKPTKKKKTSSKAKSKRAPKKKRSPAKKKKAGRRR
jgi:hypothetical protein